MARVTVEDCESVVSNRFQLVVLANQRIKQYRTGAQITIQRDNDKDPVLALREIAEKTIDVEDLREAAITGMQHYRRLEETEDDFSGEDVYDPTKEIQLADIVIHDKDDDSDDYDDDESDNEEVDMSTIIREE